MRTHTPRLRFLTRTPAHPSPSDPWQEVSLRSSRSVSTGSELRKPEGPDRESLGQERGPESFLSRPAVSAPPPQQAPWLLSHPHFLLGPAHLSRGFEGFIPLAYSKKHEFPLIREICMRHFDKRLTTKRLCRLSDVGTDMTRPSQCPWQPHLSDSSPDLARAAILPSERMT